MYKYIKGYVEPENDIHIIALSA